MQSWVKLRVRADPRENQSIRSNKAVNQDQVGLDMAIPIVLPIVSRRIVAVSGLLANKAARIIWVIFCTAIRSALRPSANEFI